MKKFRFLFVGLFMLLAVTVNAQLKWGIKAGLNVASISGGEEEIYGIKTDKKVVRDFILE